MSAGLTLVLGGARSGKSKVAEDLVAEHRDVTYVATAGRSPDDADWEARIVAHQARRPAGWATVEVGDGDLAEIVAGIAGPVMVDSLGTWLAGHHDFQADAAGLVAALVGRTSPTVVVSDEVGLGVHPETEVGRRFRDALGHVNQQVAAVADSVLLVVAGRVLRLP